MNINEAMSLSRENENLKEEVLSLLEENKILSDALKEIQCLVKNYLEKAKEVE